LCCSATSEVTPGTAVNCVAAPRFFFVKMLKRHQFREFLPYPKDRRRLPTVLSREEIVRLINAAGDAVSADAAYHPLWYGRAACKTRLPQGQWTSIANG
jgi:hypothetical protein